MNKIAKYLFNQGDTQLLEAFFFLLLRISFFKNKITLFRHSHFFITHFILNYILFKKKLSIIFEFIYSLLTYSYSVVLMLEKKNFLFYTTITLTKKKENREIKHI